MRSPGSDGDRPGRSCLFNPPLQESRTTMSVYHFTPNGRNRLDRQPSHQESRDKVIRLRRNSRPDDGDAFRTFTARLGMSQHEAGTLHPGVLQALLLGVGMQP